MKLKFILYLLFRPKTSGRENVEQQQVEIYPPSDMIELLVQENNALKLALEASRQKVYKSQQVQFIYKLTKVNLILTRGYKYYFLFPLIYNK